MYPKRTPPTGADNACGAKVPDPISHVLDLPWRQTARNVARAQKFAGRQKQMGIRKDSTGLLQIEIALPFDVGQSGQAVDPLRRTDSSPKDGAARASHLIAKSPPSR